MAQEITKESTIGKLNAGEVRPFDKVTIVWIGSAFHTAGTKEEVHPHLAKKLVEKKAAVMEADFKPSMIKGGKDEKDS